MLLGAAVALLLVGWAALLVVLFRLAKNNGFAVPSVTYVYDIYASYAPTIAATSLESVLLIVPSGANPGRGVNGPPRPRLLRSYGRPSTAVDGRTG